EQERGNPAHESSSSDGARPRTLCPFTRSSGAGFDLSARGWYHGVRRSPVSMDENPLGLKRVHHLEFWVGNARQAAYFYRKAFGFSQIGYSGLETGKRKRTSYVMRQG